MRIAWWPGHSTGRYAGSTWYADTFADEIDERCVAQLNIDSPGCADATAYEEVMWMAEADALCRSSIRDALGLPSERVRPLRAGDYSFNQIGPDRALHAPVEHPHRGAEAARLLRRRRLRRQHRVAYAGRPHGGRGPRDPATRSRGLCDDDRPRGQRAAASVRLRGGGGGDPGRRRAVSARRPAAKRISTPVVEDLDALAAELRAWRADAEDADQRGANECGAAPAD